MTPTYNRIFLEWAAKRREIVQLEDSTSGDIDAEAHAARLAQLRAQADDLLKAARAAFDADLTNRGIR